MLEGMTQAKWDKLTPKEREELRDLSGLTPQLVGLEGWRVEVVEEHEPKPRRFIVGRSTGWRPCHLEISRRNALGGPGAMSKYVSVKRLYKVR